MYDLVPFTLEERELADAGALLRSVFPKAGFSVDFLRWQYVDNPDGKAVGFNARTPEGSLAAHYATIPIHARVNGTEERGLLSLNTATHPHHGGKGLFTRLAKATYGKAADQGYGFVVGVANAASTHGFVTKLGFQSVGPLRAMVGFGDPRRGQEKESQFERLWSPSSLRWRISNPERKYGLHRSSNGVLITSATDVPLITAVLGDMIGLQPEQGSLFRPQLRLGLDPAIDWRRSFYVDVPMRFRPSPLNLIFLDLTGQSRKLDPQTVLFRGIDFDAY